MMGREHDTYRPSGGALPVSVSGYTYWISRTVSP